MIRSIARLNEIATDIEDRRGGICAWCPDGIENGPFAVPAEILIERDGQRSGVELNYAVVCTNCYHALRETILKLQGHDEGI
tara:strand:- start:727 stop:972 length:246 start_codon:yes stop_codon:yes gene_type:complete